MSIVQETLPGLYNGVSQQPPTLRLKNQCEAQENMVNSLVYGIYKRPPTEYLFTPPGALTGDFLTHHIERDVNENYIVFFTDNADYPIVVWDLLNGETKTVNYGHLDSDLNFTEDLSVKSYLTDHKAEASVTKRIRATTIADYTIVVNTEKTVSMDPNISSGSPSFAAYIYVKSNYGGGWYIELDGTQIYTTVWNSDQEAPDVARSLANAIANNSGLSTEVHGYTVKCWYPDGSEFNIQVASPQKSDTEVFHNYQAETYDDLFPARDYSGVKFKILQDTYGDRIHYYVKSEGGSWVESMGFDLINGFDGSTMPHRLVRMPDGTFVFADIDWEPRKVGDQDSAPEPSFVGTNIENVFFHQNRLGFLTKTNIIMSKTADYFDFWPTTALEVLADDPIDIGMATTEVTSLREAIPFNKNLLLRADTHQFVLSHGEGGLTPQNVAIDKTTKFPTVPYSISASAGSNLYFVSPNQGYLAVREYYVKPETYIEDAQNTTIHVPNYIPAGDHVYLLAFPEVDTLIVHTSGDSTGLYVYSYYYQGEEKPQSAWCRWELNAPIKGAVAYASYLILVLEIDGMNHGFILSLATDPQYFINLDKQINSTGSYDPDLDKTIFTLPYSQSNLTDYTIVDSGTKSELENIDRSVANELSVPGDVTGPTYVVGEKYGMLYEFTPWILKDNNGRVLPGRLQLRGINFQFQDTGYFEVHVIPEHRDTLVREFSGLILNQSLLDTGNLHTGEKRFMIAGKGDSTQIQLKSQSHLPCIIQGVTFEGFYNSRGRIIG